MYLDQRDILNKYIVRIPFGITLSKMGDPGVPLNHFFRQNSAMFFSRGVGLSFYSDPRGAGGF